MSLTKPPLQPLHPQVLVQHMMGVLSPFPVTLALPLLQRMVTVAPTLVQPHRPPPMVNDCLGMQNSMANPPLPHIRKDHKMPTALHGCTASSSHTVKSTRG